MTIQAKSIDHVIVPGVQEVSCEESRCLSLQQFLNFYDAYFGRVYNYTRYRCGDAHTADDLTSAIFERALVRMENFDPRRGSFSAWLFTIARGIVTKHLRSDHIRSWLPLDDGYEIPDGTPTPEECVIQSETQTRLLAALAKLTDRDRDILSLKFGAHLTNRRIAEITGLSSNHVGIIIYRAIHRLRDIFDERGEDEEQF